MELKLLKASRVFAIICMIFMICVLLQGFDIEIAFEIVLTILCTVYMSKEIKRLNKTVILRKTALQQQ